MTYEILYNFWLICCNIIGRLFCKRKGGHDLAGPIRPDQLCQTQLCNWSSILLPLLYSTPDASHPSSILCFERSHLVCYIPTGGFLWLSFLSSSLDCGSVFATTTSSIRCAEMPWVSLAFDGCAGPQWMYGLFTALTGLGAASLTRRTAATFILGR